MSVGYHPDAHAIPVPKADTDLAMAAAGFGSCTNPNECSAVGPKTNVPSDLNFG